MSTLLKILGAGVIFILVTAGYVWLRENVMLRPRQPDNKEGADK